MLHDDEDAQLGIPQSNFGRKISKESSNESEGNLDNDHIEQSYTTQSTMPKIDNSQKKNEDNKGGIQKSDSDLSAILLPDQNIDAKIDPSAISIKDNNKQVNQEKKHIH